MIAVLQEAALRVLELRQLVKAEVALPFGFGVRAVDRFCPVELRRSFRHGPVVNVEDVAAGVGDHGIEHRHVAGPHGLLELRHALRPSHGVPLVDRPAFFQLGQADGERLAIADGHHGALMSFREAEPTSDGPLRIFHDNVVGPGGGLPRAIAVAVLERIGLVVKGDGVEIDDVRIVDRVAPGDVAVVSEGSETASRRSRLRAGSSLRRSPRALHTTVPGRKTAGAD